MSNAVLVCDYADHFKYYIKANFIEFNREYLIELDESLWDGKEKHTWTAK